MSKGNSLVVISENSIIGSKFCQISYTTVWIPAKRITVVWYVHLQELDLQNPSTFRDLSKPMGAQTEARLKQFQKRFAEWEDPTGSWTVFSLFLLRFWSQKIYGNGNLFIFIFMLTNNKLVPADAVERRRLGFKNNFKDFKNKFSCMNTAVLDLSWKIFYFYVKHATEGQHHTSIHFVHTRPTGGQTDKHTHRQTDRHNWQTNSQTDHLTEKR